MKDKAEKKPWWWPELTDHAYCERLRADYDDKSDWSDDELREHFDSGRKYAHLWDHVGDAYEEYEKVADALLAAEAREKALREALEDCYRELSYCSLQLCELGYLSSRERVYCVLKNVEAALKEL